MQIFSGVILRFSCGKCLKAAGIGQDEGARGDSEWGRDRFSAAGLDGAEMGGEPPLQLLGHSCVDSGHLLAGVSHDAGTGRGTAAAGKGLPFAADFVGTPCSAGAGDSPESADSRG